MPFACIFVPNFPVAAILRAEPELRSQPVAIVEGKPPLEKIFAINEEGRCAGLFVGMTKLQAELCDEVVLRQRSELQESAAHQALLDCAQSFSPQVEDTGPDTLLLNLSGLGKLLGPLPKIAREIYCRASGIGLEISVAVASALEPALLAARGFSGVTVIPDEKEAEFLGGLGVDVLFAHQADFEQAQRFLETFRRWGIHKLRDLAALPEIALTERLGQAGLDLQRRARGLCTRHLVPSDPPLVFEEVIELESPIVLLEPLAFVLNRMLEQLCTRLKARSFAAQNLRLEFILEEGGFKTDEVTPAVPRFFAKGGIQHVDKIGNSEHPNIFQRTIHLPIPLLDPKLFLKLLQLDLNANPPGAPITKVHLRIEPAKPRPAQNGFFIPSFPQPEKLELTLARIHGIVGDGRMGSPMLLDTHGRDAFELHRFSPSGAPSGSKGRLAPPLDPWATDNQKGQLVTALRIFRPPIAVRVNYNQGKLSHIWSFKGRQISGDVLWSAGPWRSSGDWWEHDAWMRDEWDIAVQEKSGILLYRLIHDLIDGRWSLEGSYD
jgi:protein ImuB